MWAKWDKNRKNHAFSKGHKQFRDSEFFACLKQVKNRLYIVVGFACARGPPRPVDVAKYHVLHRQRSHVFLTLCFAQREYRGGTPFIQRVYSAQAGEPVPGSRNEVSGSSFFQTLCSAQ